MCNGIPPRNVKILFATPYLPVPPDFGGARRIYELIRGARGIHEVRTVSLTGPEGDMASAERAVGPISAVRVPFTARDATTRQRRLLQIRSLASAQSAQHRLYVDQRFQQALDDLARETDLVQFEFSQMGSYRTAPGSPTVLDVHNIEHHLLKQMADDGSISRRLFNVIELRKFRSEEIAAWKRATCCIVTSDADARVVERATGKPAPVIPNGVDLEFFRHADELEIESGLIAFAGAMRYRPNAEAVKYFADQILPLVRREAPHVRFAIVGADPPCDVMALGQINGVIVTGTVPDVRPWLARAEVVVVPLRQGGGTRLKILEAFASGRPVVSTTIGAAGIDAAHEHELLLADDDESFVQSVLRLINDPELRARLAGNALRLVQRRYQWSTICETLNDLHERISRQSN